MNLLLFFLLALLWGGSFLAIGQVVSVAPPLFCGMLRVAAALVLLSALLPAMGKPMTVPRAALKRVWIAGFFAQALPFTFLFWAEQRISPGLAGIFNGTVPIWTYLLGIVIMRGSEPPSRAKLAGVLLGLVGITLIFYPKITHPEGTQAMLGTLAVLGMALSYGAGTLTNRKILSAAGTPLEPKVDLYANVYQQCVFSLIWLGALSLVFERWPGTSEIPDLTHFAGATLYLGWLSTGIAFLIYFRLISAWGAVRASTVTYVVPVIALLLDLLVTGIRPSGWEIAGAATILTGVILIQRVRT